MFLCIKSYGQRTFSYKKDTIRWADQLYLAVTVDQFHNFKKYNDGYKLSTPYKRYWMSLQPRIGYYLTHDFAIGPSLRWSIVKSNFLKRGPAYGMGAFVRYDVGFANHALNPHLGKVNLLGKQRKVFFRFYVRIAYQRTNESADRNHFYRITKKFNNYVIIPSTGLDISIIKYLYIGMDMRMDIFLPNRYFQEKTPDFPNKPIIFPAINITYDFS